MKQAIIAILVVVGIIGAAVTFGKDNSIKGEVSSHIYGNESSAVILEEYGDFECPGCASFFPLVSQIKEIYKDKIGFQFKHNPLVQIHRNALAAHRAAEAAGKQGKFWEMHDKLYENQEEWNGPSQTDPVGVDTARAIELFETYATDIGVEIEQYRLDVTNSETLGTINADTAEGKAKYQVTGTPTFVLNGTKIDDTTTINTIEKLSALIDEALGVDPAESADSSDPNTVPVETTESDVEPAKPEEEPVE